MKFNVIHPEQENYLKTLPIPIVPRIGQDKNAFDLIFRFAEAAKDAGWVKEDIDLVIEEMMSKKYHHLLIVCREFAKESEHDDRKGIINLRDDYDFREEGACGGDEI
jgi:hypothetical protein